MDDNDNLGCVGVDLGGGLDYTMELHVIKFKQAMKSADREIWEKTVNEEKE